MINSTLESLELLQNINDGIGEQTFHHHYHILYDIARCYPSDYTLNYVEIGCYAGGSACLMLQRPNTNVISIDIGHPINPNVVHKNVKKFNIHDNDYVYIHGNSMDETTINKLSDMCDGVDILFIDGDHRYQAVQSDFRNYCGFVNSGGFIVFDDYHDKKHSPDVKRYVDDLLTDPVIDNYRIIGTLPNTHGARPTTLKNGNCFILQKK